MKEYQPTADEFKEELIMLSAVVKPSSTDFEFPKSSLNSSKSEVSLDYYAYEKDDVQLKLTTKDGDVLKLHATMTQETYIHAEMSASKGNCGGYTRSLDGRSVRLAKAGAGANNEGAVGGTAGGVDGVNPDKTDATEAQAPNPVDLKQKTRADMQSWAERVKKELLKQQREAFQEMLKYLGHSKDAGNGKFLLVMLDGATQNASSVSTKDVTKDSSSTSQDTAAVPADPNQPATVPDYWNAENTSDRIVQFATQFAGIAGMGNQEFGQKIKAAVERGFELAHAATGNLPGAAGKLNQDTKSMTFAKLDNWLADKNSSPYNQGAQNLDI